MFEKWKKARILKKLQEECFHEYHIVSKYRADTGKYALFHDYQDHYDLYCPICDKTIYAISKTGTDRYLERQKVRNEYNESR